MKHANLLGELLDFQTSLFRRKRFQFQCAAVVVNEAHVWFVPHKTIEFATSAQTSPLALGAEGDAMKTLMFYEMEAQGLEKVPSLYPAHCERLKAFIARGLLLMAGPYGNPPQGALAVFTTDEAARDFIQGDPFVLEGVVSRWQLHPWDTMG